MERPVTRACSCTIPLHKGGKTLNSEPVGADIIRPSSNMTAARESTTLLSLSSRPSLVREEMAMRDLTRDGTAVTKRSEV